MIPSGFAHPLNSVAMGAVRFAWQRLKKRKAVIKPTIHHVSIPCLTRVMDWEGTVGPPTVSWWTNLGFMALGMGSNLSTILKRHVKTLIWHYINIAHRLRRGECVRRESGQ